jgi:hypothetical protein
MKTLEDLTPEIRAKIPLYKEKCVKDLYSGVEAANFNRAFSTSYVEKIYEIAGYKKPVVIYADNPNEFKLKFKLLCDKRIQDLIHKGFEDKNTEKGFDEETIDKAIASIELTDETKDIKVDSHWIFLCSTYHRVYLMWYKFIQDEFCIEHKNKDLLNWLYDHANNNIAKCYFTEEYVLVLKMPKLISRNNVGFHNVDQAAIQWPEYNLYYINGRRLEEDLFLKVLNKTLTFDEFMKLENEDTKGSIVSLIIEKFGQEELMRFLNAYVVDEHIVEHRSGHKDHFKLWKTKEKFNFLADADGNMNQPYAWFEETCPSTGTVYLLSTNPSFEKALDCAKFHRPTRIPTELVYDIKSFNS